MEQSLECAKRCDWIKPNAENNSPTFSNSQLDQWQSDIGNADDVDDDVATHENLAERIDRFMLSDRPPASDIRSEVHVSHDPKARLNLLNQAFAALVNK